METTAIHYTSVLLVRAAPETVAEIEALARAEASERPLLLFFHGDGVLAATRSGSAWSALAGAEGVRALLCAAALQRRAVAAPIEGFEVASLVRFWDALAASAAGADFLVRIDDGGDARTWQERLELILAGASLDLDLRVLLEASAWRDLRGKPESWAAWQQLFDHGLARVGVLAGPSGRAEAVAPAEWVEESALEDWREGVDARAEIQA